MPASSCMRGEDQESPSGVGDGLLIRVFGRVYSQAVSIVFSVRFSDSYGTIPCFNGINTKDLPIKGIFSDILSSL